MTCCNGVTGLCRVKSSEVEPFITSITRELHFQPRTGKYNIVETPHDFNEKLFNLRLCSYIDTGSASGPHARRHLGQLALQNKMSSRQTVPFFLHDVISWVLEFLFCFVFFFLFASIQINVHLLLHRITLNTRGRLRLCFLAFYELYIPYSVTSQTSPLHCGVSLLFLYKLLVGRHDLTLRGTSSFGARATKHHHIT